MRIYKQGVYNVVHKEELNIFESYKHVGNMPGKKKLCMALTKFRTMALEKPSLRTFSSKLVCFMSL